VDRARSRGVGEVLAAGLPELKSQRVADVCIVCCDGLTGLPEAITVTWPQAIVQLCVVHYADFRIMPT
jgi:transposase-like protein